MRLFRLLVCSLLLNSILFAQQPGPSLNGQQQPQQGCFASHKDAAVNTQVVVTIPAAPLQEQYVYICGWDWQVSEDTTGTAQANVLWTTTNLGSPLPVAAGYSVAATPSLIVSGNFTYPTPVRANAPGPVVFTSPTAAAHASYSLNVYYRYGN